MTFGSPGVPCAQIEVMSIGKLGVEENKVLSKKIFDFIKEKLKIEGNRCVRHPQLIRIVLRLLLVILSTLLAGPTSTFMMLPRRMLASMGPPSMRSLPSANPNMNYANCSFKV